MSPYYGGQTIKVLVWDRNKYPEYRGFLIMEVKQYTLLLGRSMFHKINMVLRLCTLYVGLAGQQNDLISLTLSLSLSWL